LQGIGGVGSSGSSTGAHLHLEIRRDGIAEDPRADLALP
jgi:murein DD-endopeptidase MepM/ murein hydrolase activator NlpD